MKSVRDMEIAQATAAFEIKKEQITKKHDKQLGQEKTERLHMKAEVRREWADFRKENGISERQSEWQKQRDAHKAEFNKAAEDRNTVKTEIAKGEHWQKGTVSDFVYAAKVYDGPSPDSIQAGNISKLELRDMEGNRVASFDRGWNERPKPWEASHGAVEAVTKFHKEHADELRAEPEVAVEQAPDINPSREKSQIEIAADAPDIGFNPDRKWDWEQPGMEEEQG